MRTLNISLPEQMRSFVEAQVNAGMYSSVSDYIRALIRADYKRQTQAQWETKLLEALDNGKLDEETSESLNRLCECARETLKSRRNDSP